MREAASAEVARNFSEFREIAQTEPVVVQHYGKPSVVIMRHDEYLRLARRDKKVFTDDNVPDWLIEKIMSSEMDPRHNHLDEEE